MDHKLLEFPVIVYGNFEKYSEVASKARCRIFYKGGNRNGTYITDEFADSLLKTIPYTPVKSIYDGEDFTDHGKSRQEGRIYGIVPENPNLSWEKHLDEDGIEREYACVDVIIFTALYPEANEIVGKPESMELYNKSIKGDWQFINGKKYFVFSEASFLGLQVLGNDVEPCFEGAAFFTLYEAMKSMVEKFEKFTSNLQNNEQGGQQIVSVINYKLSDNQKFNALWSLLNTNYCAETNWLVEYDICEIYDKYAVVRNYNDQCFERVYYTKDDATDSLTIDSKEKCYILDVSEGEKAVIEAMHTMNNGTYEKMDENFVTVESMNSALEEKNTEYAQKIEELNSQIATLTTEKDELNTQYTTSVEALATANANLESANTELEELHAYKLNIEKNEKTAVINSYAELLDEEIISKYTDTMDNYSALELDKELAYELKNTHPSVFNKNPETIVIPKADNTKTGLEEILSKYKK